MNGIFISYRRDDSSGYAGRLYDRLAAHFGADRVFMDVEGIEPGADFVDAIDRAIATCAILIVIIGKEWLAADSSGHRRIDDAADFVRVETVMALSRGIRVVPVLVDGADMPHIEELPVELAPLVRRQAVDLSHKQWDATSAELIRTLEKILDHATVPPASAARAGTQARGDPHSPRAPPALSPTLPGEAESGAASTASAGTPGARMMVIAGVVAMIAMLAAMAIFALRWHGTSPLATPPMLVATPEQLQFAETPLHSTPVPAEITLQNRGGSGMHVREVRIDGAHAADFTLTSDQCSGRELPPAASCTVNVSFVATLAGARTAALLIQYDEARGPVVVGLQGHGAPPVIASTPSPTAGPAPPGAASGEQAKPTARPARTSDAPAASTQEQPAVGAPTRPAATPPAPPRAAAARPPLPVTAETAPAASAKTPPLAAPATVPVQPGAQAASGLPRIGDNWQYRYRSMWRNVEPRTYAHQVNASSPHEVRETMTFSSNGTTISDTKSFSADTRLVEWRGQGYYIVEFNPFMQALGELQPGMAWKSLATPVEDSFVGGWYTQGRALGWETVSVPAGTFKALRVEIYSNRNARANAVSDPARVLYVIWYAPEARRAIRHVRTVFTSSGDKIAEDTFELMQYALK